MKKVLAFLIGLTVVVFVFAFLSKDWLLKAAVEQAVSRITGFKTEVGSLKYDFPATIQIQGLKINNPSGFREGVFADIPEIYADLDLPPLLKGEKVHLREVRLNIAEIHLEKNISGVSNLQMLSSVGGPAKKEEPKPHAKKVSFELDRLELTMRQVSYEDAAGLASKIPGEAEVGKIGKLA